MEKRPESWCRAGIHFQGKKFIASWEAHKGPSHNFSMVLCSSVNLNVIQLDSNAINNGLASPIQAAV